MHHSNNARFQVIVSKWRMRFTAFVSVDREYFQLKENEQWPTHSTQPRTFLFCLCIDFFSLILNTMRTELFVCWIAFYFILFYFFDKFCLLVKIESNFVKQAQFRGFLFIVSKKRAKKLTVHLEIQLNDTNNLWISYNK